MNCNTTHYRANSSSVPGDPTGGVACGPWLARTLREKLGAKPEKGAAAKASPSPSSAPVPSPEADRGGTPGSDAADDTGELGAIRIPSGPNAPAFRTLRDSRSAREIDRTCAAAASNEAARLEAEAQYRRVGFAARARLLRLILASERRDPNAPARLEEAYRSGDLSLMIAAVEQEADTGSNQLPVHLSSLGKTEAEKVARLLGEALLGATTPTDDRTLAQLRHASSTDREIATRVAPVALLAGGGEALHDAVDDLGAGHGVSRKLAQRALEDFTGEKHVPDAFKDAEGALASWTLWARATEPALELWRRACADTSKASAAGGVASVASCQEARVQLVARPRDAVAALRSVARDSVLRSSAASDGLAVVLPRVAGPADASALAAFLDALPQTARGAGPGAVAGAIAAADSAVVAAAGRAILRGAAPLVPLAQRIPDLVQPQPDALAGIARMAQDLPPAEQAAACEVRGAFRDGRAVVEIALGTTTVEGDLAEDALARAGYSLAEDWLVRAVLGVERIARYPTPEAAARGLAEVGTRGAARSLLARAGEKSGSPVVAIVLGRLGGPAEALALVRLAEQHAAGSSPAFAEAALAAAARIAGPEALERIASLAAGEKPGLRALAPAAQLALAGIGHPGGRDLARKPFEELLARGGAVPSSAQVAVLVRAGLPEDATLLLDALDHSPRDASWEARALRGIAVLDPHDVRGVVRSRLARSSPVRGEAALVLARTGDDVVAASIARLLADASPKLDAADALALAALATTRPDLAAPLARPRLETTEPPELDAVLLALALSPEPRDPDVLDRLASSPQEARRASVARVLLALGRAQVELPRALELEARLRLDPSPVVRAVAAVAASESGDPRALSHVLLALDAPASAIARPLDSPALVAVWPHLEAPLLQEELARALDQLAHERGVELEMPPSPGRGRIREAQRIVRGSVTR